jgi:hypothetical protein
MGVNNICDQQFLQKMQVGQLKYNNTYNKIVAKIDGLVLYYIEQIQYIQKF